MTTPVISAKGMTRRFGNFVAVDAVDLHVAPGEVFGLLGANGAGKTTSIRMLCGLLPASSGDLQVAGVDINRHPRRARARIGYMAQRFSLYTELSVRENLELQAGLYALSRTQGRERIAWALDHLHLAKAEGQMAGNLPLGYRQRLSLAAALLHQPQVLFLDEPTSGVDPLARQRFWELIYDFAAAGMGVLVTTHYMDEARFCDRLALMHRGRIVIEGRFEEVAAHPLPTPLIELHTSEPRRALAALLAIPQVIEAIPKVGGVKVRLREGCDPVECTTQAVAALRGAGIDCSGGGGVAADLEDLFVSIMEGDES
ncbi:MAG: multidrug ABC transporter ATP-binding protein [Alphaproteobacteria bacterium CG_4_10_14_0_2_um_filter_63_37]|nr:MAG: hypothetical protein AUJ55_07265 [Proteobacteria bacterium CG1_02_64_396]PJA25949.1 MAG: multidrug ABC transporter ATP-binding protein [Alphaproteobacteria bacterium CG_4_10_14_0_2_um_filter_63_37]